MASAIGLRQAFPMQTNNTFVRLDFRTETFALVAFCTIRVSRCPALGLFLPPQAGENARAPSYRRSIPDETWRPRSVDAAPVWAFRRIPQESRRLARRAR